MKLFVLTIAMLFNLASFAAVSDTISAESNQSHLQILDLVVGVHQTYSKTSQLEAKVIELLGGDGMNPTRMVLILSTGYQDTKIFDLGIMMYSVKRVVFLDKDVVVVNYTQDTFKNDTDMTPIQVNKSVTVKALRNADGTLANKLEVLK